MARRGAILTLVFLLAAGCARQVPPPSSLAGLALVELMEGEEAQRELEGMHRGTSDTPEQSYIASYAGAGGTAVLYVSAYPTETDAQRALERMIAAMAARPSPFSAPEAAAPGLGVWRMQGIGQEHALWAEGRHLIWLQSDLDHLAPGVAQLRELY